MDDYRNYVNAIADLADGKETILNKTADHAGILIAALFRKAKREVLVVSGEMDGRAFDIQEVADAAKVFLSQPGAQLKIVVQKKVSFSACKFLAGLRDAGLLGNVEIALAHDGSVPFHFMLADGEHYRFEANPARHEAIAQFGAPSVELRNAFDMIWKAAEVFTPAP